MNERLDTYVALAVKNNLTPNHNCFAGFIHRVSASKFGTSRAVSKSDLKTLVAAWRGDKWQTLVQDNPYFTAEEKQAWTKTH